jgi:DNA-binding MarR family transcriptional regulator
MNDTAKINDARSGRRSVVEKRHFSRIAEVARQRGLSDSAAEALVVIDADMFTLRRRMMKRDLVKNILNVLNVEIDLAEFEALTAISRMSHGIGMPARKDVTIGDVAEDLAIDPSRASRLVSGLVTSGFIRREADQGDGRKSILRITEAGLALLEAFVALKWQVTVDTFADWPEEDILRFRDLFARNVTAFSETAVALSDRAGEFAHLSRKVAAAREKGGA